MATTEEKIQTYITAIENATRQLGYSTVSVETLNLVVSRFMDKHKPPQNPSERMTLETRNFTREELVKTFQSSLKESFRPTPKDKQESVDTTPPAKSNVVSIFNKKARRL